MPRLPDTTPKVTSAARLAWLRKRQFQLDGDIRAAREGRSWSAVAALHREARAIRDQVDTALAAEAAARAARAAALADPTDLSPDEWRARNEEDAREAEDDDLMVYVREWLQRRRLLLLVEDGEPRIVRRRETG